MKTPSLSLMNFWGNAEAYADVQQPSAGFQSKHTCSVVFRKHGSEGKHRGQNRIFLPAATYKMQPVFGSEKDAD